MIAIEFVIIVSAPKLVFLIAKEPPVVVPTSTKLKSRPNMMLKSATFDYL